MATPRPLFSLRPTTPADTVEIAELYCVSMNYWYRAHGKAEIFPTGPEAVQIFIDTYDLLDPGCCIVAEHATNRRLMGASFYHPRPTHVSLGMLAVHPNYFSAGVGSALVRHITALADQQSLPTRLVSSAHNLDSFSLYTRNGFVPRATFQDVLITVPPDGDLTLPPTFEPRPTRPAVAADSAAIAALERSLTSIYRPQDWAHFLTNALSCWSVSIVDSPTGPTAALASISSGGMCIIGPGFAADIHSAAAALRHALLQRRGKTVLLLLPVDQGELVQLAYRWGARNIEMHLLQVRGAYPAMRGVVFPSFLPESL